MPALSVRTLYDVYLVIYLFVLVVYFCVFGTPNLVKLSCRSSTLHVYYHFKSNILVCILRMKK